MKITDETLMAYVDGELDAAQRAEVEHAIAADPQLAIRVKRHQALSKKVKGAFDHVLSEPVPDRLLATLGKPVTHGGSNNVISLKARQQQLKEKEKPQTKAAKHWALPQWTAVAAALVVGAIVGIVAMNMRSGEMIVARNGSLVAGGSLANALTSQLSNAANQSIDMKLSFKTRSGEYCRSFVIKQQQSLAGLACRNGNEWRVPVLTGMNAANGTYRQAGSELPQAVVQWIDTERAGDALDVAQEETVRKAGWK